ncbi:hypothetical protein MRX96_023594 [Rhipicephalus microplus]
MSISSSATTLVCSMSLRWVGAPPACPAMRLRSSFNIFCNSSIFFADFALCFLALLSSSLSFLFSFSNFFNRTPIGEFKVFPKSSGSEFPSGLLLYGAARRDQVTLHDSFGFPSDGGCPLPDEQLGSLLKFHPVRLRLRLLLLLRGLFFYR